ncbi:MAG: nuclear transport factor 2 family protein, partial [Acidobacteriota bacterium]|nr:nuclear transport factor 2 family protein [Acidobacteriota bacterium]
TQAATAISPEVQALLDKDQIEDLVTDYYTQLGTGGKGFSDYYVEDAVLDVNGQIAQGSEGIEDLYKRAGEDSVARKGTFRMMLTNILIDVKGETATASMLWTGVNSETVESVPVFIEQGRENDEFVKRDGRWYFKHRAITSDGGLSGIFKEKYQPR